jgi:glutathione peroxidase
MARRLSFFGLAGALGLAVLAFSGPAAAADCPSFLDQTVRKLHSSETVNLCKLAAGKPLLVINTASHCGFTPQFKGLEALHRKYQDRGLVVVGFSSDDFNQEAKDEAEAAEVCFLNNGVTFTMIAPSAVTGAAANPVFKELARQSQPPDWNFNKYLVTADGKVVRHFESGVTPESAVLNQAIEGVLAVSAAR